jgi:putative tricarboxylic transport membrane protein
MKIRDAKDFWSGIMFAAFGLGFVVVARSYDMGTAARMGPAFFPTMLGGLLFVLGVIVTITGLAPGAEEHRVDKFHFKPLALVLGAVVAFGLLLRPAGMLVALATLVFVSSLGGDQFRLRDVLLLTVGLAALVLAVFLYGLGMTIPVLPAFMQN